MWASETDGHLRNSKPAAARDSHGDNPRTAKAAKAINNQTARKQRARRRRKEAAADARRTHQPVEGQTP
eukprot:15029573-Alexandrium_andersonii.AAC.1